MGSTAAVKGVEMSVQMAGTKAAGSRQSDRIDDGSFQKLLNSKAEEDAGTASQTKDTKGTDKKEVTKDQEPKKTETKEQPEENTAPEETALEQAQAALLFQINPEVPVMEEASEEVQLAVEIGVVPAEEVTEVLEPVPEQPIVQTQQSASNLTEISEETVTADVRPEEAVLPKEAKEERPETKASLEKPKETTKTAVKEEQHEVTSEQPLQSIRPETHTVEQTSAMREVPTEHVRVQEPEEIPEKLLDQLLVKTTAGIKEFEIQLEPYDLGKIIIKAAFGKESTSISIVCTEQRTMELMAKNARELGAIMEDNLGTPTTIVVEDKEAGYLEQQNQNNSQGGNGQNQEENSQKQGEKSQEKEGMDFLQQLRLGLV